MSFEPKERRRSQFNCTKGSKTEQAHKDQTDINRIMRAAQRTGQIPGLSANQLVYGDISEIPDPVAAFHMIEDARRGFMRLPAAVRQMANHDPATFLQMVRTEDGLDALVKAGLEVEPKPEPKKEPAETDPVTKEGKAPIPNNSPAA